MPEEPTPESQDRPAVPDSVDPWALARNRRLEYQDDFIGPQLGWWHRPCGDRTVGDMIRDFPVDPYLDTAEYVDLDTADALVAALDGYQREVNHAEARRIDGLLRAYRAVLRQAGELGQSRSENGVVMRAFVLQAALSMQVAESTATTWLYAAESLEERCPRTWARFLDGVVSWRGMRVVDQQGEGLDVEHHAAYDEAAADLVGLVPVPRLKERLHATRERLQADTADERHRSAFARRTTHIEPMPDGMGALTIVAAAPEVLAMQNGLRDGAVAAHGVEGETRGIGQLMSDIAVDLLLEGMKVPAELRTDDVEADHGADAAESVDPASSPVRVPGRKGVVPQVSVLVPVLTLLGASSVPATLHGYGPIGLDAARRLCGAAPSFTRILTHPVTGVRLAVDATTYSPPADLRRYLAVRDGTCRAPGCTRPVAACDIDHVEPWMRVKRTEHTNLAHLCRRHHQVKGSRWWDTTMTEDAVQTWTSAWGTTHTTRPADEPEPTPPPTWYEGPPINDDPPF